MDDAELNYILDAVEFVAEQGYRFLPLYDFDLHSGAWSHKEDSVCLEGFSLQAALECKGYQSRALSPGTRSHLYRSFLAEARKLARELADTLAGGQAPQELQLDEELERLKFFTVPTQSVA
jgi:hypothetical protein